MGPFLFLLSFLYLLSLIFWHILSLTIQDLMVSPFYLHYTSDHLIYISKSRSAFTSAFTWCLFLFESLSFLTRHFSTSAFLFRLLWSFLSTSFDLCLRYLFIIICSMFIKFFNAHTLSHAITKQGTLARKVGFNTWKSDEETEAFVNFKDFSQFWKMGKCRD